MWSRIPWCETSINQQPVGMSIPIFAHLSMEAIGMQLPAGKKWLWSQKHPYYLRFAWLSAHPGYPVISA